MGKDKPGYLEGVGKDFLGVPHSLALTRTEQILREQVRANEGLRDLDRHGASQGAALVRATERAATEARADRAAERQAIASLERSVAWSAEATASAVRSEGEAARQQSEAAHARAMGIVMPARSVAELLGSGSADEAELVVLAGSRSPAGGSALTDATRAQLLDHLPGWKQEVVASGLVGRPDPKQEQKLPAHQRAWLYELRRAATRPPEHMRSLRAMAHQGMLDPDWHDAHARSLPSLRVGIGGLVHGVNAVEDRLAVANEHHRAANQHLGAIQGHTGALVSQGQAQVDLSRTAVHLARAGLLESRAIAQLNRQQLAVQEHIAGDAAAIRDNTAVAARTLPDLLHRAMVAERQREAHLAEAQTQTALAHRAQVDRQALIRGVSELGALTDHYGALHARQLGAIGDTMDRAAGSLDSIDQRTGALVGLHAASLDQLGAIHQVGLQAVHMGAHQVEATRHVAGAVDHATAVLGALARAQLDTLDSMDGRLAWIHSTALVQLGELEGIRAGVGVTNDLLGGLLTVAEAHAAASARAAESLARMEDALGALTDATRDGAAAVRDAVRTLDANQADRALRSHRIAGEQHFREAMVLLERGRVERAAAELDKAEALCPSDPRVPFHRAMCRVRMDDAAGARADLDEALALLPRDAITERAAMRLRLARLSWCEARAHSRAARAAEEEQKLAESLALTTEALQEDPDSVDAQLHLATCLCALGATERAIDVLFAALPRLGDRGARAVASEAFVPVHDVLRAALDLDDPTPLTVRLARDALAYGDPEAAARCLRAAATWRPRDLLGALDDPALAPVAHEAWAAVIAAVDATERDPADWYALAALCATTPGGEAAAIRAFRAGAAGAPREAAAVREALESALGDAAAPLIALLRRDRSEGWRWLAAL